MRFVVNFILVAFFVVLFLVSLLTATFKFQLLDYNFWQNTFQKQNVYQNLAVASKDSLESQISKEGGNKNDVKVLTNLITTETVKDLLDNNVRNILSFTNGKVPQIIVYIPIKKFPKNLLPKNLVGIQSEISLEDLLTKFNYQGYSKLPINQIAHAGDFANSAFFGSATLLLVVLVMLILLVESGRRLIAPGVAVMLAGFLATFMARFFGSLKPFQVTTQSISSFNHLLIGILLPPLLSEIAKVWYMLGISFIALGIILFIVKKPGYKPSK